jgi:hypothetical protein
MTQEERHCLSRAMNYFLLAEKELLQLCEYPTINEALQRLLDAKLDLEEIQKKRIK